MVHTFVVPVLLRAWQLATNNESLAPERVSQNLGASMASGGKAHVSTLSGSSRADLHFGTAGGWTIFVGAFKGANAGQSWTLERIERSEFVRRQYRWHARGALYRNFIPAIAGHGAHVSLGVLVPESVYKTGPGEIASPGTDHEPLAFHRIQAVRVNSKPAVREFFHLAVHFMIIARRIEQQQQVPIEQQQQVPREVRNWISFTRKEVRKLVRHTNLPVVADFAGVIETYNKTSEMLHVVKSRVVGTDEMDYTVQMEEGRGILPLTLQDLATCLVHVAKGLRELHRENFVHRDVRWPNVMWFPAAGAWKLIDLDWGARLQSAAGDQESPSACWPNPGGEYDPENEETDGVAEEHLPERPADGRWRPAQDFAMGVKHLLDGWNEVLKSRRLPRQEPDAAELARFKAGVLEWFRADVSDAALEQAALQFRWPAVGL